MNEITPDDLLARIEEFRNRYRIPGIVAGIVNRAGVVDQAFAGVRARGADDPVRADDRWHLGSCGKSVTAALFARLVERGDAEWGAVLPDLLPDLAAEMDPGWAATTVDSLLVHRSGMSANLETADLLAAMHDERPVVDQRTEATARAVARAPSKAGDVRYSNLGYIVVGAAIERITGLPYESALDQHVLAPLGITSGGLGPPPEVRGHANRMRLGSVVVGRGAALDPDDPEADNPPVMGPVGRLHLTLDDWAKFQRVFLTDGGGFLRPETVERLVAPGRGGRGRRHAMGWMPSEGSTLAGTSMGQQGSNTFWVATAIVDEHKERTAMVVCNDGRTLNMVRSAKLAVRLLASAG